MPFACSSLSRNFKKFRLFEKENEAENARIARFNTLFSYLHFEFAKIKLGKITKLEISTCVACVASVSNRVIERTLERKQKNLKC